MSGADICIQRALEANVLREPLFRSVIRALDLSPASHGLDAGCGIGLQALLLAEAIGAQGHITGIDILPDLLVYAEGLAAKAGYSNRIIFRAADAGCLPFDDNSFDWAWSADCVGYPAGELGPVLQELMRVVRPGGQVILLGWSSQQLLPGYPLLEARLNATCSAYSPFLKGKSPGSHFMRAASHFRSRGLKDIEARSFLGDIRSPLSHAQRTALISLFEMLWEEPQPEVSAQDWAEYKRLCTPRSQDFILDLPEYYAFFTYSMFRGRVPE